MVVGGGCFAWLKKCGGKMEFDPGLTRGFNKGWVWLGLRGLGPQAG